jgi:hypothetical protein
MAVDQKAPHEQLEQIDEVSTRRGRPRIQFRTVNGSLYEIDYDIGIWRRLNRTNQSGDLRFEGGELLAHQPLKLGQSAFIVFVPFDEDDVKVLMTSPIASIEPARHTAH